MDELLKLIIDAIKEEDYQLISIVLLVSLLLWLYNEFRKSYLTNKLENKSDIEKALKQYSKLYFGIKSFQAKNINLLELYDCFNQAIIYLPRSIIKEIFKLDKDNLESDSQKLENLKKLVENEILSIKFNQNTITTFDYKENILSQMSWSFSQKNFDSFFNPLIYTFFTIVGVLFITMISIGVNNLPRLLQINILTFIINTILSIMILMLLIDLNIKKSLKTKIYIYFCLLIVIPAILNTFIFKLKYSIINMITIIIFLYLANKESWLKSEEMNDI